jgi:hypothetical protein
MRRRWGACQCGMYCYGWRCGGSYPSSASAPFAVPSSSQRRRPSLPELHHSYIRHESEPLNAATWLCLSDVLALGRRRGPQLPRCARPDSPPPLSAGNSLSTRMSRLPGTTGTSEAAFSLLTSPKDWKAHYHSQRRQIRARRYTAARTGAARRPAHTRTGYTATVFGATGFLGRYIVNRLGA